ncbi:MAG: hypothetical protein IBX50_07715 [Marinospirillum sp.]|uniref:hypothetical protein n=1 Tax=Marinospirillum sp. TaxID=2183934 RepID=UPI0019DE3779|nr:hypothetical protein [Marinospirillum sp.]MBE0506594.1 hypothetical protein [Marinospirillum sp.]
MSQPNFNEMISHPALSASDKVILNLYVRMDNPEHDGQVFEPELSTILRKMRTPNPAVL